MPTNNSINSQDPIQVAKGGTGVASTNDTAKIDANVGNIAKQVDIFGDTTTPRTGFSGFLVC